MHIEDVVKAWNAQADEYNQWDNLDADERVNFALQHTESFKRDELIELERQVDRANELINSLYDSVA